jgi:integrase/recombinase XerC
MAEIEKERSHPHSFRHTYAIVNLAQGVPVTVVQEWLGHANILNTLIYTRILAQHSKGFAEQVQW